MRLPVPILASQKIIDNTTPGSTRKGLTLQNVSAVDIYVSDDQRLLDSVTPAGLPTVGLLFPASAPPQPPTVFPYFIGKLFARAQASGAQLEFIVYEVDNQCK